MICKNIDIIKFQTFKRSNNNSNGNNTITSQL